MFITAGNDFSLRYVVTEATYTQDDTIWVDVDLTQCSNIQVFLDCEEHNIHIPLDWSLEENTNNVIIANVVASTLHVGTTYGTTVTGLDANGKSFRWNCDGSDFISIVEDTNDMNLEGPTELDDIHVKIGLVSPQGPQGAQGTAGRDGVDGVQGAQGNIGNQGEQGNQGEMGYQGNKGDRGFTGYQGERGQRGAIGYQGDKGDRGPQGYGASSPAAELPKVRLRSITMYYDPAYFILNMDIIDGNFVYPTFGNYFRSKFNITDTVDRDFSPNSIITSSNGNYGIQINGDFDRMHISTDGEWFNISKTNNTQKTPTWLTISIAAKASLFNLQNLPLGTPFDSVCILGMQYIYVGDVRWDQSL